jgi:hypothetical protein
MKYKQLYEFRSNNLCLFHIEYIVSVIKEWLELNNTYINGGQLSHKHCTHHACKEPATGKITMQTNDTFQHHEVPCPGFASWTMLLLRGLAWAPGGASGWSLTGAPGACGCWKKHTGMVAFLIAGVSGVRGLPKLLLESICSSNFTMFLSPCAEYE